MLSIPSRSSLTSIRPSLLRSRSSNNSAKRLSSSAVYRCPCAWLSPTPPSLSLTVFFWSGIADRRPIGEDRHEGSSLISWKVGGRGRTLNSYILQNSLNWRRQHQLRACVEATHVIAQSYFLPDLGYRRTPALWTERSHILSVVTVFEFILDTSEVNGTRIIIIPILLLLYI